MDGLKKRFSFVGYYHAQQVSQRDAPPVGGFEVWFFQGSAASFRFR
jgi:hypothetical protein